MVSGLSLGLGALIATTGAVLLAVSAPVWWAALPEPLRRALVTADGRRRARQMRLGLPWGRALEARGTTALRALADDGAEWRALWASGQVCTRCTALDDWRVAITLEWRAARPALPSWGEGAEVVLTGAPEVWRLDAREVRCTGGRAHMLARFDAHAREAIEAAFFGEEAQESQRGLAWHEVRLGGDGLCARGVFDARTPALWGPELGALLDALEGFGARWSRAARVELPRALAVVVEDDRGEPVGWRADALDALLGEWPEHEDARRALHHTLSHHDITLWTVCARHPRVVQDSGLTERLRRCAVATLPADASQPHADALVTHHGPAILHDPSLSPLIRARLLPSVLALHGEVAAWGAVVRMMGAAAPGERRALLMELGRLRVAIPPELLVRWVQRARVPELPGLLELADAAYGDAIEACLAEGLARWPAAAQVAALELFARRGGLVALGAVQALDGPALGVRVRELLPPTLAQLRARCEGPARGALSLSYEPGRAGALSVAARGAVTLHEARS